MSAILIAAAKLQFSLTAVGALFFGFTMKRVELQFQEAERAVEQAEQALEEAEKENEEAPVK